MRQNQESQWMRHLQEDFAADMRRCDQLKVQMQEELIKPNPDFDTVDALSREIAMLCGQMRELEELDKEKQQLIGKLTRKKRFRHLEWIGVTAAVLFFGIGLSIVPAMQAGRDALEIVEPVQSTTTTEEAYAVETSASESPSEHHTTTTEVKGIHTETNDSNLVGVQTETSSETLQVDSEAPKRTTAVMEENVGTTTEAEPTKHTTTKEDTIAKHTTTKETETTKHTTTKATEATKHTTTKVTEATKHTTTKRTTEPLPETTIYTTARTTVATTRTTPPIFVTTTPPLTTSPPPFTTMTSLTTLQTSTTAMSSSTKPTETIIEENKPTAFLFIHSGPNKISYNIGEELDLTGVTISFGYVIINSEGIGKYDYTVQEQDLMSDVVQEFVKSGELQIDYACFDNQTVGNQRIMVYYTYEGTVAKGGTLVFVSDTTTSTTAVPEVSTVTGTTTATTTKTETVMTTTTATTTTAETSHTTTLPRYLETALLCCDERMDKT